MSERLELNPNFAVTDEDLELLVNNNSEFMADVLWAMKYNLTRPDHNRITGNDIVQWNKDFRELSEDLPKAAALLADMKLEAVRLIQSGQRPDLADYDPVQGGLAYFMSPANHRTQEDLKKMIDDIKAVQ